MNITNDDLTVLLKHKYNVSNETIINELKDRILMPQNKSCENGDYTRMISTKKVLRQCIKNMSNKTIFKK